MTSRENRIIRASSQHFLFRVDVVYVLHHYLVAVSTVSASKSLIQELLVGMSAEINGGRGGAIIG
jgi:hypothetical protein